MPKSILKKQQFNAKKPYFVATVVSLALGLAAMGWFYDTKIVAAKQEKIAQLQAKLTPLQEWDKKLSAKLQEINTQKKRADQLSEWLDARSLWIEILSELRTSLLATESRLEAAHRDKEAKVGVWVEKMMPDVPGWQDTPTEPAAEDAPQNSHAGMSEAMRRRYGFLAPAEPTPEASAKKAVSTNEISTINLTCAAVNLQKYSATANISLMEELKSQLLSRTNLFSNETDLGTNNPPADLNAVTFNFQIVLKLKRPIKI